MKRYAGIAFGLVLVLLAAKLLQPVSQDPIRVHWILHDRNATDQPIYYWASIPNANMPTGFIGIRWGERQPGIGILEHYGEGRDLPHHLRYHWTLRDGEHWRFDDVYPYRLIPPEVIARSRYVSRTTPPLLIRITFLPEGRLRFSWHACVDDTCRERGSPALTFDAVHDFQGVRTTDVPPTRSF